MMIKNLFIRESAINFLRFHLRGVRLFAPRLLSVILIWSLLLPAFLFFDFRVAAGTATAVSRALPAVPSAPSAPYRFPTAASFPAFENVRLWTKNKLDKLTTRIAVSGLPTAVSQTFAASGQKMRHMVSARLVAFGFFNNASAAPGTTAASPNPAGPGGTTLFDFDGDGKADLSRWQPGSGQWRVKRSSDNALVNETFGASGEVIVPANYDGDNLGIAEFATFKASTGVWKIKNADGSTQTFTFGQGGDQPVVADYDGDGKADAAVFRASNSTWYVRKSFDNTIVSQAFGSAGDIPTVGNFDGDTKCDYAVFRPSTGQWYILQSSNGNIGGANWGVSGDIPVAADYDGDGKSDYAVYRPAAGIWYVHHSSTGGTTYTAQAWGNYGDQPVPADYDNDNKADFAVWRPTTGVWHLLKSTTGLFEYKTLGAIGDVPTPAAYLPKIGNYVSPYLLAKARLSPKNETGGTNLYSQNFGWGTGLVGLAGRGGLDAGLSLSYNSLIWTRQADNLLFDTNADNVSPGFRFGFPTVEAGYLSDETGKFNYLMVSPSGGRTEFRQVGVSDVFEATDSSYAQIKVNADGGPNTPLEEITLTLTNTSGTRVSLEWKGGAYRVSQIKDRNGNFITVNHDEAGILRSVTDTLGRVITVNYDSQLYPTTITQTWQSGNNGNGNGSNETHTWASFSYTTQTVNTNFDATLTNYGPPNGTTLKVLEKVTAPDGSFTKFEYNGYGQVFKVTNVAADSISHELNYVRTNLQTPAANQPDCPRFTKTYSWVENYNGLNDVPAVTEVTNSRQPSVSYAAAGNAPTTLIETFMTGDPHAAISKTYVGETGWREGLPIVTEDWATGTNGLEKKRWTQTNWTQDFPNETYLANPRVVESKVGDTTNIKRSTVDYYTHENTNIAIAGLVSQSKVYDTDQTTVLKRSTIDYNFDNAYLSRRIIGLPTLSKLYDGNDTLLSQVSYQYDAGNFGETSLNQSISPLNHDTTNYGAGFIIGRGNLTSVTRYDATGATANVTSRTKYNTAGLPVAQIDPLERTVKIEYNDSFNDGNNSRNTFAYPTKLTDLMNPDNDNNFSTVKYRYDIGANVWAKSPKPQDNTNGKISTRIFDELGRLQKESVWKTPNIEYTYTRYEYPNNQVQAKVYTTLTDTNNNGYGDLPDEVLSESWTDGAGRVLKSRVENPSSTGGFTGSLVEYNQLGQVKRSSVPTEISVANPNNPESWQPAGDDATRGWIWIAQEYDWKGRNTRTINTDGTDTIAEYDGCGCAGGEVVTVKGEIIDETDPQGQVTPRGRRSSRMYSDILGRKYKTETLNWDGGVYSSTVTKFNGRDQAVWMKQFDGVAPANALDTDSCPIPQSNQPQTCQISTMTYDGHARLKTSHSPQQDSNRNTIYDYFNDDQVQSVTDARGAKKVFEYNERGLLKKISYTAPPNGEALRPGISIAGRNSGTNSVWFHGLNFAADATVFVARRETDHTRTLLAQYTGGQLTRGTTSEGQQSITFQATESAVITALNENRASLFLLNNISGRTSNSAYQDYNGNWGITPRFSAETVEAPAPVNFTYDDLGNRVSMTDAVGVVDYEYNELSQIIAEKRAFNDSLPQSPLPGNSFKINYQYGLSGGLKSVTDPFGYQTNYVFDKTGRTLQVNGQVQFVSGVKYRAWGGIKEVGVQGGVTQTLTYDNRLRISEFRDSYASGVYTKFNYSYQADGTMFKVDREMQGTQTSVEMNYNRHYQFDHLGRMVTAKSGKRAHGETAQDCDVPFELQTGYDKFGHLTTRNSWIRGTAGWNTEGSGAYTDNRSSVHSYDADGRIVGDRSNITYAGIITDVWGISMYRFNAAGLLDTVNGDDYKQNLWQDGNGINTKQEIWTPNSETGILELKITDYFINSSVLGEVIAKADKVGNRTESIVYGLGRKLGTYKRQKVNQNSTQYHEYQMSQKSDPSGTYRADLGQSPDGFSKNQTLELTPENVNINGVMQSDCPPVDPVPQPPLDRYDGWRFASGSGDAGGCTIDGVESSCDTAYGMLANGSGYEVALGTSYFDLSIGGYHVGGGALASGWMPVDSFGYSSDKLSNETAKDLISPNGKGLSDNWRQTFGISSISSTAGNTYEESASTNITGVSSESTPKGLKVTMDLSVTFSNASWTPQTRSPLNSTQDSLYVNAVDEALKRLETPKCYEAVSGIADGKSGNNQEANLKTLKRVYSTERKDSVFYHPNVGVAQAGSSFGEEILLGDKFFSNNPVKFTTHGKSKGKQFVLAPDYKRIFVVLHELRHIFGGVHRTTPTSPAGRDPKLDGSQLDYAIPILEHCFGIKTKTLNSQDYF